MTEQIDMQRNNRIVYLDLLRIAATFIVMMLHISSNQFDTLNPASLQWKVQNIYDGLSRWGVGIFVMISGALFLKTDIPLNILYRKYVLRILIAMVFWTVVYSLIYVAATHNSLLDCLTRFDEVCYHLWFLLMITGLYIIVPFLKIITENEKLTRYFLIVGLLFAFIIPETIGVLKIISPSYGASAQKIMNQAHFHFVLGFPTYFILGHYLSSHSIPCKTRRLICFLGVLGFAVTALGNMPLALHRNKSVEVFFGNNTVNVLLEGVSVFVFFKHHFGEGSYQRTTVSVISALSKYSFGAYLVHVAIISFLEEVLKLNAASFNPIIAIPVTTLLVFIASFAVSAVLNQIPIVKKYVV